MLNRLREVLLAEGYSGDGLAEALGGSPGFGLPGFDPVILAQRLPAGAALRDLVTLFLLGGAVRRRRLERLFGRKPLGELERAGILRGGDALQATLAIHVWGPFLLACDRHDTADRADHVVGMTAAAATLAHLTVRPPGAQALDLGTGCGVGAVVAAAHGATVTATDFNARAVELAGLSAALNGQRMELLEGDWFAPVDERAFDLIVSNPPYVVSPDSTFVYRDGADRGDEVSERVVRESARHLRPGGFATVLCNWIRRDDGNEEAPLRWVAGSGCDAVVIRYGLDDPVSYAASWNHHLRADPAAFEAALERWTDHYRDLGVRALASGAVVLRKGGDRAVAFEAVETPSGPAETQLRAIFDPPEPGRPLRPLPGLVIEQTHAFDGSGFADGALAYGPSGIAAEIGADVVDLLRRPEIPEHPAIAPLVARGLVG